MIGCIAMPQYIPMEKGIENQINTTTAHVAIRQDEIIVTAQSPNISGAAGGGLLVAMIDSAIVADRQLKLQQSIEPLYDSIDDYDYRKEYWKALEPQIRESFKLNFSSIKKSPSVLPVYKLTEIKQSLKPNEAFMYVGTSYTFNNDFSSLKVITGIDIYRGGSEDPVYSNLVEYNSVAVGKGDADSLAQWAANKGKLYRQVMAEGIAENMKMIRLDMEKPRYKAPEPDVAAKSSVTGKLYLTAASTNEISGMPLDISSSRVVIRNEAGRLLSLPK